MEQVFLSYSSENFSQTIKLMAMLEDNSISCWLENRDMPPGTSYTEEITHAIDQCQVFVLVLTEDAQNSQYVMREIECAIAKKKPIIIYMLENFTISERLEFHLRHHQRIHAYENKHLAQKKLVECIKHTKTEKSGLCSAGEQNAAAAEVKPDHQDVADIREPSSDGEPSKKADLEAGEKVFLSYESHDVNQVEKHRKYLENNGIPCWIAPRDIPYGSNYAREIPKAIANCKCVLVFVSKQSQNSEHIEKEIEIAVEYSKPIIPVRLQDCEFEGPYIYHLKNKQWFNAYKASEEDKQKLIKNLMSYGNAAADEPRKETNEPAEKKKPSGIKGKIRKFKEWYREQTRVKKIVIVLLGIQLITMAALLFANTELGQWTIALFVALFGNVVSVVILLAVILSLITLFASA